MNTLFTKQQKAIILLLISIVFTFESCTKSGSPVKQDAVATKSAYSGEDIFNGIFMLQGDFGKNIAALAPYRDELEKQPAAVKSQHEQLAKEIVQGINTLEPTYFSHLKTVVNSGNLSDINEALTQGAKLYLQAGTISKTFGKVFQNSLSLAQSIDVSKYDLTTSAGIDKLKADLSSKNGNLKTMEVNPDANQCLVGAAVVAAVVWEVVAVVNVALVATFYTKLYAVSGTESAVSVVGKSQPSLSKETIVLQISNAVK